MPITCRRLCLNKANEIGIQSSFSRVFHNLETGSVGRDFRENDSAILEKPRPVQVQGIRGSRIAPNLVQVAVNGLHSADFKVDRAARFLLTLAIEGVKTYSFFGSF